MDSIKKNAISLENNKISQNEIEENTLNEKNNVDSEMKIENENSKNSIISEKMNLSHEEEFKKTKSSNDSYNNIDNSYGDNYSTANSNVEIDIIKSKQNLNKEGIEYNVFGKNKIKEDMTIIKEDKINFNTQNEEEYIKDIFENLIKEEKNMINIINPNYFEYQKDINQSMRSILIDWLIDVHNKLNFKPETLYMTIYIIDSYLSQKIIQRKRFQLLGVTALLISTKFNEVYSRRLIDYVFITDNAYTIEDIKIMEKEISKTLNFNFLIPSALSFYEIISKNIGITGDKDKYNFGEFLIQSFLIDFRSLSYSYSTIAYTSCYLVMKFYQMKNYQICFDNKFYSVKNNSNIVFDNNGNGVIKECAQNMCRVISEMVNSNYQSTIKKYSGFNFYDIIKNIFDVNKK